MKNFLSSTRPKLVLAGLAVAVAAVFGVSALTQNKAQALPVDCDTNAIVKCGFQDKNGFKSDYNANVTGDLPAIYEHFNFSANEMDRFMSTAVWATAYKDGRIVLDDGRVVATKAWSIGRETANGTNPYDITIGNKLYHWGYNQTAFAANSIRTLVMMDKNNKYMEFAVITSCGNPVTGIKPVFQCNYLKKEKVNETTYKFWTDATAKDGATIKNLHYDFGDGTSKDTANKDEKITHVYKKAGKYHIKVTITYVVNGKEQTETLQINCQTDIEVKEQLKPAFECTELKRIFVSDNRYKFVGLATYKDAKVTGATFDFGDGQTAAGTVKETSSTTAEITAEHQFAEFTGTRTITLDVEFTIGKDKKNARCQTQITREVLPKEIVRTGPAEVVGAALGLGGLTGAGMYYRASRRNLLSSIFKR